MSLIDNFISNTRNLMKDQHITINKLAVLTGLTRQTISCYFNGKLQSSLDRIDQIATALDVSAASLLCDGPGSEVNTLSEEDFKALEIGKKIQSNSQWSDLFQQLENSANGNVKRVTMFMIE